jgi:hypothetical protein
LLDVAENALRPLLVVPEPGIGLLGLELRQLRFFGSDVKESLAAR